MSAIVLEDFVKPSINKKMSNRTVELIIKAVVLIFGAVCVALVFVVERLGTVLQVGVVNELSV